MKNTRWSPDDFKKKGLVEVNGSFVKASSVTTKGKVEKLPNLIERAGVYQGELNQAHLKLHAEMTKAGEPKPKGNRRVKNAEKIINEDGVKFDSGLEKFLYESLQAAGVSFEFQKVFILQEKFRYGSENIRAILKVVDFWIESRCLIVDSKGFSTDISILKHKMLKYALLNTYGITPEIIMPSNKKEVTELVNKLRFGDLK